ncbi:hypothetical protein GUITHDRAFT_120738 [Guillardia theta CCMP2712]|uniref:Uncharacterized protein n=1 Tax=Guillardia theta (strain CCMP2712) TaxID=905079 RepID=L1IA25_GUITC|nr:hypothetical protein GUITHDRAFT_120738 [Guillardia theta CCMP2712]EKX33078.1 hypothetical protein GUITHDRAFT_120738 [Guillardia theta CCMP2712]|eukprot:XP_005820058.1 hypothetical protein GUITHDRAFT_120738 [Guillardia theta CCMP2712]
MREWSVTLIRLNASDNVDCIQIVDGKRRSCSIPKRSSWEGINRMLEEWQDYKKGFVVLDGFLRHESHHVDFLDACRKWLLADRENRRVVVATSMLETQSGGEPRPPTHTRRLLVLHPGSPVSSSVTQHGYSAPVSLFHKTRPFQQSFPAE